MYISVQILEHHITFMQESHIIGHKTTKYDDELKWWTFINSRLKGKASAGVGIALVPDVKLIDIENIIEGRILLARIVLHGINTCFTRYKHMFTRYKHMFTRYKHMFTRYKHMFTRYKHMFTRYKHMFTRYKHMLLRNNIPIPPNKHSLVFCKRQF